jgi:hypothetical protein
MAKERKLPEILEHDFIICDNSVNRYGWRLLVEGIDLSGFLDNPVCCVRHNTYDIYPVGRWKNIRVEDKQLKGTVEFDRNDDEAVKLYWKYADGYMNAVSLHVIPLRESKDDIDLLPGQKYPTLTNSELLEISLVIVPGQKNAIKLSTPTGEDYKLDLLTIETIMTKEKEKESEKSVEQLTAELEAQRRLNAENIVSLHRHRGVVSDCELDNLQKLAFNNYDTVKQMLEARVAVEKSDAIAATAEAKALALVDLHFNRGAITAPEKEEYKKLAIADYESVKKVLELRPGTEGLPGFIQSLGTGNRVESGDERKNWGYYDYFKKDPEALSLIEKTEPDQYKRLIVDFEAESKRLGVMVG